jgi:hypothetical protein
LNNQEAASSSDTIIDVVHSDSGTFNQNHISNWILDSGASRHVTGKVNEFTSYTPYSHSYKGTIKTTDGTLVLLEVLGQFNAHHLLPYHQYYMFHPFL